MHVIQLRGPWEREVAPGRWERFDWERDAATVLSAAEPVTVLRRFGKPTGIEPGDTVRLVIAGFDALQVWLNDAPLPIDDTANCDLTALLAPRNVLRLTARRASDAPQVRLEIIAPAAVT